MIHVISVTIIKNFSVTVKQDKTEKGERENDLRELALICKIRIHHCLK